MSQPLDPRRKWDRRYANLDPEEQLSPAPFVVECLNRLPATGGHALDIAAGAGRHTLALARYGWHVDAVDLSEEGIRRARERVPLMLDPRHPRPTFIAADVEQPWLPHRQYDLIVVTYFLYRPLFPLIMDRLTPNGHLIYTTFVQSSTAPAPMRQAYLLRPNELRLAFASLDILTYDEEQYDDGRIAAKLFARNPSR